MGASKDSKGLQRCQFIGSRAKDPPSRLTGQLKCRESSHLGLDWSEEELGRREKSLLVVQDTRADPGEVS